MADRKISSLNKFQMVNYLSRRALAAFGNPLRDLNGFSTGELPKKAAVKKKSTKRKSSGKKATRG